MEGVSRQQRLGLMLCIVYQMATAFKVAVYDQAEFMTAPAGAITRDEALWLQRQQLDVYENVATNVSMQGVVMVVFSEYGLMPLSLSRDRAYNFTEIIVNPKLKPGYVPCTDDNNNDTLMIEVQRRLSCVARQQRMYVVANVGENEPCRSAVDPRCPPDGRYQFNTNVVFDPAGTLVARYRKYNLFMNEPSFNQPSSVDYTFFDTPYGRFGAIVCFDIIFREPPVTLIENNSISHVLFPTGWMNVLPYYSAVTFHQAFAVGLGVNLLASNRHNVSLNMVGSGVYGSDQTYAFRADYNAPDSGLVVADIPAEPIRTPSRHPTGRQFNVTGDVDFTGPLFADVYNFGMLTEAAGVVSVCHNSLCCLVNYTRDSSVPSTDTFALGAFRGLHTSEGRYYLEMCVLLKCHETNRSRCDGDSKTSNTKFTFFSLTGNFSTKYVYPMVVTDGIDPSSGDWKYDGESIVSHGTKKALVSSTMYGRRFDLDNGGENPTEEPNIAIRSAVLVSVSFVFYIAVVKFLF